MEGREGKGKRKLGCSFTIQFSSVTLHRACALDKIQFSFSVESFAHLLSASETAYLVSAVILAAANNSLVIQPQPNSL